MPKRQVISAEDAVDELMGWVDNDHASDNEDFDENDNNLEMLNGSDDDASDIDDNIDPDTDVSDGYVSEDNSTTPAGPVRRTHRRKKLTYQRDVNSIDSALDENNYTP